MTRPLIYDDNFIQMIEIIDSLIPMMNDMVVNLLKARGGNQLAAQRTRLAMIKFEKKARDFRKASVMRKKKKEGSE